ncbi:hypothetical protein SASPL_111521 [Salvia splendens]|uniref:Uncharacterized protein n=1 Tax=Salvia splendens TaxID=180675 RepID=A0A8X8Y959_SALSN|nr:hypothetical protein SASPL_111521 [Salvia splendens]
MVREVSESCVESLLAEIVLSYCSGFYANKPELAARRIEAIDFQVGHQLSERSVDILRGYFQNFDGNHPILRGLCNLGVDFDSWILKS